MGENADQNISEYGHLLRSVSSIEVWTIWYFWHENWALFTSNCCSRNRNNSNSKTYLLFLSVIEDIYLLLITCLSHPCYRRYIPFVNNMPKSSIYVIFVISLYFIMHSILNCHRQWLVYKQKNINTHGSAKREFYINTRRNF